MVWWVGEFFFSRFHGSPIAAPHVSCNFHTFVNLCFVSSEAQCASSEALEFRGFARFQSLRCITQVGVASASAI